MLPIVHPSIWPRKRAPSRILIAANISRRPSFAPYRTTFAPYRANGVRNSHLLALAPTGTVSLLGGNVSSGLEPISLLPTNAS